MSADDRALDARDIGQEMHAEAERRLKQIDADAKALSSYHEDPNHFYASRTTTQRVAGFIGVLLGGFAQGIRGGQNVALEQMNKAQDDDIAAQRHNYMANRDSLEAKRSAYGMAMEKFHNDFTAQNVVRMAQLDRNIADTEKMMAQHRGTEAENNGIAAIQGFLQKRAEIYNATHKYVQAQAASSGLNAQEMWKEYGKYYDATLQNYHKGAVGADGTPPTPPLKFGDWLRGRTGGSVSENLKVGAPGGPNLSKGDRERAVLIDGKTYLAVNQKAGDAFRSYQEAAPNVRAHIEQLKKAMETDDPTSYNVARLALIEQLPKLYGFQRGPSETQAGGGHQTSESMMRATLAGQIPEYSSWKRVAVGMSNTLPGRAKIAVERLDEQIRRIDVDMRNSTFEKGTGPSDQKDFPGFEGKGK